MAADPAELSASLAVLLSARLRVRAEVTGLERLSGGASRETFAFDLDAEGARPRPLILQRERAGGRSGMAVEAGLVRAAARWDVPVPQVVAAQGDPEATGPEGPGLDRPWMIADRVAGETLARRLLRDDEYADARPRLVGQCAAALAAVHRIPPAEAPELTGVEPVDQQRTVLDQLGQPHPAIELGLRWLEANRPDPRPATVVHGDFRTGNLVVGPDGLRAVLDWELAHLGDPIEDLGWFCVRAWRFGSPLPAGGFGTREELLAAYEEAGGGTVDPAELHWWEVLGTLKWGVICVMQATAHLTGLSRSVELAAIGRRVCETEHDLLEMLP